MNNRIYGTEENGLEYKDHSLSHNLDTEDDKVKKNVNATLLLMFTRSIHALEFVAVGNNFNCKDLVSSVICFKDCSVQSKALDNSKYAHALTTNIRHLAKMLWTPADAFLLI